MSFLNFINKVNEGREERVYFDIDLKDFSEGIPKTEKSTLNFLKDFAKKFESIYGEKLNINLSLTNASKIADKFVKDNKDEILEVAKIQLGYSFLKVFNALIRIIFFSDLFERIAKKNQIKDREELLYTYLGLKCNNSPSDKRFLLSLEELLNDAFDNLKPFTSGNEKTLKFVYDVIEKEAKFLVPNRKIKNLSGKFARPRALKDVVISDLDGNEWNLKDLTIDEFAKIIFENTSIFAKDNIFKKSKIGVGKIEFNRKTYDDEEGIGICEIKNSEVLLKFNGKQVGPTEVWARIEIECERDEFYEDEIRFDSIRDFNFEDFYWKFGDKLKEMGILDQDEEEELLDELDRYLSSFESFTDYSQSEYVVELDVDQVWRSIERIEEVVEEIVD